MLDAEDMEMKRLSNATRCSYGKEKKTFKRHVTDKYSIFTATEDSFSPVVGPLGLGITEMKTWEVEMSGLHNLRRFYHHLFLGARQCCRPVLKWQ